MSRTGARALVRSLATGAIAFLLGMGCLVAFLALAGYEPLPALLALWRGAFGSRDAITSATLVRAAPLIVLGLAFGLATVAVRSTSGWKGSSWWAPPAQRSSARQWAACRRFWR